MKMREVCCTQNFLAIIITEKIVGQKIAQLKDMYQISSSPHQFFIEIHLEKKESILILLQVKRVKATEDTAAIEKWIRSCDIYHIFFTMLKTLLSPSGDLGIGLV